MDALVDTLKKIPHLKLGIKTDPLRMRMEAARIPVFKKYAFRKESVREHYNRVWSGAGIKSFDGDPYSEFVDIKVDHDAPDPGSKATKYAATCPYLFELADQFEGARARVLRIASSSDLMYHAHVLDEEYTQDPDVLIVQMPFVMPPNCYYSVIEYEDYAKNGVNGKQYNQHYAAGEVWIFNNVHQHNVCNPDPSPRLTFMFYAKLSNPAFRAVVEEALAQYQGPYLETQVLEDRPTTLEPRQDS